MADKDTNMNFRIEKAKRKKFSAKCKKDGVEPSNIMRRLMDDYTTGAITYGPSQQET